MEIHVGEGREVLEIIKDTKNTFVGIQVKEQNKIAPELGLASKGR